ncbi:Peroxisome biosynthesis PAS1 [Gossypium arboreum]|uniref:Peroxisome biosynthesis PAS1 n=1 Tax=Gossypium arboreum TaxID=29729 RepID=A0A0B0NUB4_GOSAR|nr:Peroxisome biosynthesis PAS1 [Gossypium arboreum]
MLSNSPHFPFSFQPEGSSQALSHPPKSDYEEQSKTLRQRKHDATPVCQMWVVEVACAWRQQTVVAWGD